MRENNENLLLLYVDGEYQETGYAWFNTLNEMYIFINQYHVIPKAAFDMFGVSELSL